MSRPTVHVVDEIHPEAMRRLSREARVLGPETPFPGPCDAVITRTRRIGAAEMDRSLGLRVVAKHGTGLDAIDLDAAKRRGIEVISTPGVNAAAVSELAIGLALALLRDICGASAGLRAPGAPQTGWELGELRAGVFGLGAIGRGTARLLQAGFDARVRAHDPGIAAADWPAETGRAQSLDELLAQSDIVFLHVPLLPETRHCLNARRLAAMPRGSWLINCARGGIVDEPALAQALRDGHLAGAASDVFEIEPPGPDHPLLTLPNFIATPHIGAATNGARRRVGFEVVARTLALLGRDHRATAEDDNEEQLT